MVEDSENCRKGTKMKLGELAWPDVEALDRDKIVILPVGSFEQHGRHLPLMTDTMIVTALAEKVEADHPEQVLLLPTLWVGYSAHHVGFPGTVTVEPTTYIDLLCQILQPLIELGFRKILALNGHGGNEGPVRIALRQMRRRFSHVKDLYLVAMSDWTAAPQMLHACELETSLMLYLRKDLVRMEDAQARVRAFHSDFYSFDFDKPDLVQLEYSFKEVTETGALGHPELASAEEGERLLREMAEETSRFISEFVLW